MSGITPWKDIALPEFAELAKAKSIYESYGLNPKEIAPEMSEIISLTYLYASIPIIALYGESPSFTEHAPFFNFVQTTPAGNTLSLQASLARREKIRWGRFCHSIRQPGFVFAWFIFCKSSRKFDDESVSEHVKRLRDAGEPTDALGRYAAEKARDSIPLPGTIGFEDFIIEQTRHLNSRRKKKARNKPPKRESRYKAIVSIDFLANALWCRSSSDIVSEYFPDSNAAEHEKHEREFNKAFSKLNLSKARRNDIPQCPDIHG